MEITASQVKELRDRTGTGMMECKDALVEAKGDLDEAIAILRKKGLSAGAKRAHRATEEGQIASYIHVGGKIGVMVEVNCETDFVAKTDEFQQLVRDLAMQVAATAPRFVTREEVPAAEIESERSIYRTQAEQSGKPAKVLDRIVDGQIDRFYQDVCLLEQPFIKQNDRSVKEVVHEAVVRFGVNVEVRRFARYQLGEMPGEQKEQDAGGDTAP